MAEIWFATLMGVLGLGFGFVFGFATGDTITEGRLRRRYHQGRLAGWDEATRYVNPIAQFRRTAK